MVRINGNDTDAAGRNVLDYLESAGFDTKRLAVEINGEILPKSMYATSEFNDGDTVEIVTFVGGG